MTAATKKPDAFGAVLDALAAVYEAEIARLVDVYRPRILAGEFSGVEPDGKDVKLRRLEDEIDARHPWIRTVRGAMAVIGVSPWTLNESSTVELSEDRIVRNSAAECIANDLMTAAVARGWVKPLARGKRQYEKTEPYALRVA